MSEPKARMTSIKLDASNKRWIVEFRVPETEVGISSLSLKIPAFREPDRGPEEEKTVNEVISEARVTLANALWPMLRAAINGSEKAGTWAQFISIARSAAADAQPDAGHDA